MQKMADRRKTMSWLVALGLVLVLWAPGNAGGEFLKVGLPNQSLYPDPDFASATVCKVPLGVEVEKLLTAGDWFKVIYQDNRGWMNRMAFPELKQPPGNLPGLLTGGVVREPDHVEVALGGKAEKMPLPKVPLIGDTETILYGDQVLYPDPDPAGAPLATVPRGAQVKVLALAGEWCKVDYRGKTGWLQLAAFRSW
jgi:hypothetical protein